MDASRAVELVVRDEYARVLAHLIRVLGGDFQLAEDALMDSVTTALERWPQDGVPDRPAAWLTTVARRKALDRLRHAAVHSRHAPELRAAQALARQPVVADGEIPDEQLKLFFTCCHPALSTEAQVALTLRTLAGLTTPEIAAAFLVSEATMAQRLVRAKRKIRDAAIPYRVPPAAVLAERLTSVLQALYLVFNEGYRAHTGHDLVRRDLCREAIRLAEVLAGLMPEEPEIEGLLALMLLHDARSAERVDQHGVLVSLDEQDRTRWDRAQIARGRQLVRQALGRGSPGPYQIQAAIAALHAEAPSDPETDWQQIALLYGWLEVHVGGPVVALNRWVAVGMAGNPEVALTQIEALGLHDYQPFHAARAELLVRADRHVEADAAYSRAIELAAPAERAWLERKRRALGSV